MFSCPPSTTRVAGSRNVELNFTNDGKLLNNGDKCTVKTTVREWGAVRFMCRYSGNVGNGEIVGVML